MINVPLEMTPGRSRVYVDSVADMTLGLEFRDSVSGEFLVQAATRWILTRAPDLIIQS